METLDSEQHATPLRFFLATNRGEVKWMVLTSFFYGCGAMSLIVASYFLGEIVDLLQSPVHASLVPLLVFIVLSLLCYEIGYRVGHTVEVTMMSRIRKRIKRALFDHTTSLSFGYFADRFAGEIAHKVSKTADAMERLVLLIINQVVEETIICFGSAFALAFASPALAVFVLVWTVVFIAGIVPYARRMDEKAVAYALSEARTSGAFVDVYGNIAAAKVYGLGVSHKAVADRIDAEANAYRALGFRSILIFNFMGLSMTVLGSGLLVLTALLYARGDLNVGSVVFISSIGIRLVLNVWEAGKAVPEFIRQRGEATQNLEDLIAAPAVVDGDRSGSRTQERVHIDYKDVTFGYSHERPVLDHFSFSIKAEEKVGIVGLSGAGKTTFANLLLRFFDVQGGEILLNGEDIRDFTQEYVRSHISYISQDTSLFHASVAENIAYGAPAASREDVERAAGLAYAAEFIAELQQKYESIVGERGVKLSGGQRQRIAIARAILADRPIFLLDEATSALDSDSESKIQKGLAALMEGKTVIAIAHRLSTLSRMDRIIFLEGGRIAEDGTHEELLAKNGKYAALWRMQAGGFLPDDI